MFAWVGANFDAILSTYVLGVVSSLMSAITPIALSAMTLWVALYGWAVLRNEVSETVPTFVWKVFKIGLVLAFALQSGFYISNVSDTANGLAMGVALVAQVHGLLQRLARQGGLVQGGVLVHVGLASAARAARRG